MAENAKPSAPLGKRLAVLTLGYSFKKIESFVVDNVLYGAVAWFATSMFGTMWGTAVTFIVMAPVSAFLCWWYIRAYDILKMDWFGFEALKEIREDFEGRWYKRLLAALLRRGDTMAFVALSIFTDPFMTTVYMRKNAYGGLTRRDRLIFWKSVIVSNMSWVLWWIFLVEGIRTLARVLPEGWLESLERLVPSIT